MVIAFMPEDTIDELSQVNWDVPKWLILIDCDKDDNGNYWLDFGPELSFSSIDTEGYPFEAIEL
jgi:hypothetical protein